MSHINPGIKGGLSLDGDPDHIRDYYRQWAEQYDKDVADGGYTAAKITVDCLFNTPADSAMQIDPLNRDLKIHDAGCGTGLVGVELHQAGYGNIDGSDLSRAMVDQAEERGIYRELTGRVDLTEPVRAAWLKAYDVVTCCGVFTCGHVPPDTINRLFDMTVQGGLVIVSTRTAYYDDSAYQAENDRVIEQGKAKLLLNLRDAPYTSDGDSHYWVYLVLE